jgi:regulatory protein
MSSEAFTVIYNKALDLVSRREHSRHELMFKLDKRYPETSPIIEEVLDKLEGNKILDDERFAEMYLNSRARKGFGPKKNRDGALFQKSRPFFYFKCYRGL